MEEYRPNSNKSKEDQLPERRTEKVISGGARPNKKSDVKKLADIFISEDVDNVKSYILMDVLVPAIKKALSDIVTNGLDMILYGESGRTKKNTGGSKVSYRDYYDRPGDRRDSTPSRGRTGYGYEGVIIDDRAEAVRVLAMMDELISQYDEVRVADLYDMLGMESKYTDNNYGWTDIRGAVVARARDGWTIKLPRAQPLN